MNVYQSSNLSIFLFQIELKGTDKRFTIEVEMDKQNIIRTFKVERFLRTTSLGFVICSELKPTEDSFHFTLSFESKCKVNHFEVSNTFSTRTTYDRLL